MAKTIKADGDRWRGKVGERQARAGYRTVVFFCESNGQRPYRVIEVPEDRIGGQEDLDRMSESDLLELFSGTGSMDSPLSSG
jgi:hypothetical protein